MSKLNKWDEAKRLADDAAIASQEAEDEKLRIAYSGSEELKKECKCACHDTEWNSSEKHLPVEHDYQCCKSMNGFIKNNIKFFKRRFNSVILIWCCNK